MDKETWTAVLAFTRAVKRQSFEVLGRKKMRQEFFNEELPNGKAGDHVERAMDEVLADDWEAATERLGKAFEEPSICAKESPNYTVESAYGTSEHFAACHLHREDDITVGDAKNGQTGNDDAASTDD